jgi:DNA-binding MarR family transcriptional regulator
MSREEADVRDLHMAIFRMVSSFRRQRGEFSARESRRGSTPGPLAARHMGAAEQLLQRGPMSVGELAGLLRIELTTTSKLATELEEAGIIARHRDADDGRKIVLEVAAEAGEQVRSFMAELHAPLERAAAQLSAAERAGFLRGLTLYAEALEEEDVADPPETGE